MGTVTMRSEYFVTVTNCPDPAVSHKNECNAIMQYHSLLPKNDIRFRGSMFLSSSDILS